MVLFRHNLMHAEFLLSGTGESNPRKNLDESDEDEDGEVGEWLVCFDHSKQRLAAAEEEIEVAFDGDADAACERSSHVHKLPHNL